MTVGCGRTLVVGCVGGMPIMLAGGRLLVSTVWGELANMDSPVSEEEGEYADWDTAGTW